MNMDHGQEAVYQHHPHAHQLEEDELRMMDESMEPHEFGYPEEDELAEGMAPPRAVHQCNICNKIFVSFKGLQQHSVIHTDQKPFQCDICGKSFRFKSNLFEHRSVHTGFTPHACPYCGKTCRLKGNLKKHLKTHVSTKEELEEAWRPFASNRRPPADIPDDAIIVRGSGEPYFSPPTRPRKRKLGLGPDPRLWIDKIRRGEILPQATSIDKLRRLNDMSKSLDYTAQDYFEAAKGIAFERFECPTCKSLFLSRNECYEHIELDHPMARVDRPLFCEICLKAFADRKSMEQHESYHKRVHIMMDQGEIEVIDPEPLMPHQSNMDETEHLQQLQSELIT